MTSQDASEFKERATAVVNSVVDRQLQNLNQLSTFIHSQREVGFKEIESSKAICELLTHEGFEVEHGVGGLPTAFRATTGTGKFRLVLCAEYDALPNIGHACGHNLIAASSVGAALALKPLCDELDMQVTVVGTPAEEGGGGKIILLQQGVFDSAHLAMMIHPANVERDAMQTLAVSTLRCDFFGESAHAAARPEAGVSASAALALAQSGIAFMREHLLSTDRVHGIVEHGGDAPNIVPDHTTGRFFVRARAQSRAVELEEKVRNIFRGAAMMTGCRVRITKTGPSFAEVRTDADVARIWRYNAANVGRTSLPAKEDDAVASTDMGNVSQVIASIHPLVFLPAETNANIHEVAFEKAAASNAAQQVIADASRALAMSTVDVALDSELRARLESNRFVASESVDRAYLDEHWQESEDFDPRP